MYLGLLVDSGGFVREGRLQSERREVQGQPRVGVHVDLGEVAPARDTLRNTLPLRMALLLLLAAAARLAAASLALVRDHLLLARGRLLLVHKQRLLMPGELAPVNHGHDVVEAPGDLVDARRGGVDQLRRVRVEVRLVEELGRGEVLGNGRHGAGELVEAGGA